MKPQVGRETVPLSRVFPVVNNSVSAVIYSAHLFPGTAVEKYSRRTEIQVFAGIPCSLQKNVITAHSYLKTIHHRGDRVLPLLRRKGWGHSKM